MTLCVCTFLAVAHLILYRKNVNISNSNRNMNVRAFRTVLVTAAVLLAVAVPTISPFIGLIGAFCFSILGLLVPVTYLDCQSFIAHVPMNALISYSFSPPLLGCHWICYVLGCWIWPMQLDHSQESYRLRIWCICISVWFERCHQRNRQTVRPAISSLLQFNHSSPIDPSMDFKIKKELLHSHI